MKYVKLGNTGVDVSRICLGMMSFGKPGSENGVFPWARDFEDAKPIFKKAVDLGLNYFDTANVYQMGTSEEVTGRLIREFGLDRDDIVVATKVNMEMRPGRPNGSGLSRKEIMNEIDKSLKRLQLDYVDLYQIHRLDPGISQHRLWVQHHRNTLRKQLPHSTSCSHPMRSKRSKLPTHPMQWPTTMVTWRSNR